MNLIQPILNHARTRPHCPALIDRDREITYGELAALVLRTASHLAALGAAPGVRVGLCLRDRWEHVVALLAIARMGAVVVPLHWRATRSEISELATALSVRLVLVEPGSALDIGGTVVPVDAAWQRSLAQCEPLSGPPDAWDAPFVIAATSGSTSAPRFSIATHLQFYCGVAGFIELLSLSGHHRYLSTLPLYFSGGRLGVLTHLLRGDCVVLYGPMVDGHDYVRAAVGVGATVGFVVPSLIRDLLAMTGDNPLLPGLARLTSVGAPLFPDEKRAAKGKISSHFCDMYGTTESNPISLLPSGQIGDHAESVGQPHSLMEVQIVDGDDRPIAPGQEGTLRLRGPALASPLAVPGQPTHLGFRDGWFHPGDVARLDELGYLYLTGRHSELIIRHGVKIYPAEVEAALQRHPDVLECAVIGRRTRNNEEEVIAFLAGRRTLELGAMVAHCRTHLESTKRPQHIHFMEALPRNPSGKIDKQALAELVAQQD